MEFAQLAAVVAVAEHGTFTAAAVALGQTQPAVSLAVKRLEAELGTELFERRPSGVALTSAGAAFLEPARRALGERDTAAAAVAAVSGLDAGHLDLASIPSLAADLAAPTIGAFRRRHDGITVRLREPDEGASVEALVRAGRSEIGFCAATGPVDGLVFVPLESQEMVAVLSPGHARSLARRGAIPVERLAALPLITAPEGASTHRELALALAAVDVDLLPAVVTDHRESIVPLVLAGAGAAVLPRAVAEAAGSAWVQVVPLEPPVRRSVGLVHRGGGLSPAGRAFVDLAVAVHA